MIPAYSFYFNMNKLCSQINECGLIWLCLGGSVLALNLIDVGQIAQHNFSVGAAQLTARDAAIAVLAQHQWAVELDGFALLEASCKDSHAISLDDVVELHHFVVRKRPSEIPRHKTGRFEQFWRRHGQPIGCDAKLDFREIRAAHRSEFLVGIVVVAIFVLLAIALLVVVVVSVARHFAQNSVVNVQLQRILQAFLGTVRSQLQLMQSSGSSS